MSRSPLAAAALVALSGAAYAVCFPPISLGVVAWVGLVPLLVVVLRASPLRAAAYGALWALVATCGVAWWLPRMLEAYFGLSTLESWLGLIAAALLINALPYAAFAAWLAWLKDRRTVTPLLVASSWGVAEFARAQGWLANPFALIAYTQHESPFAQVADLVGPYGLGMLVVAVNAALAHALLSTRTGVGRLGPLAATALVIAAAFGYGTWRLAQDFGEGEALPVVVVQGGIARELVWDRSTREANLERYLQLTEQEDAARARLVFWPEFAIDFYLNEPTPWRAQLLERVRARGSDLVAGAAHYQLGTNRVRYHNSVYVIDGDGFVADRYDKQRLVPFAEYGPLGDFLRAKTAVYAPGGEPRVLRTDAARVGAFLCGEVLFPEIARELARQGAEVLANPSNDYWFGHPSASLHQLQMASLRAIENRRWLVRPTATGVSALIDPHGHTVARSGTAGAEVLSGSLRRSTAVTVYQVAGDAVLALALLVVLGALRPARR